MDRATSLLGDDEALPVTVVNPDGASAFLIVADHAGNAIPRALAQLGLPATERARHIAWDIGIAGVCQILAARLDATLIQQNYSRLVIDCNRPPDVPSSIPELSEATVVPGNLGLPAEAGAARRREIFVPYHDRIAAELDRRLGAGLPVALVAMHSFTPSYLGVARPWEAGVLYNRDRRLARAVLAELRRQGDLCVGDNAPYDVSDATDYTIPVHGERRRLLHVGIEIRQDLIAAAAGQAAWGARLADTLPAALAVCLEQRAAAGSP